MRKTAAATILTSVLYLAPAISTAGDEVDYSAPYLTVENGELVTKYPPKAHTPDPRTAGIAAATGTPPEDPVVQRNDSGVPPRPRHRSPLPIVSGIAAILLAVILLVGARRRRPSGG